MEGVGARLGRSSSRYGPAPVFTGPVRKWKKKWVHVPPPNSNHHNQTAANGSNGSAHLLLFKWTPIAPGQIKDNESNKDDVVATEEPPRRRFKYIPIVVLEEQNDDESSEQMEDETKPIDNNTNNAEATSKSDEYDEKLNMNDIPMDENQVMKKNPVERQDLNESTLDLSLGLNAHDDGENDSDSKAD
ncbi:hypothetical protein PHJA_002430500 [Phtheirospermum japonicum]|uniref:Uncharacterized protein n=1 Tax=Phtheirospermum japonicum TaxID=374723 RepID=A0A830D6X0_9LAMI|nr:hypothetical protein PHJA_002430500 [Phtheirospermum japonicum]